MVILTAPSPREEGACHLFLRPRVTADFSSHVGDGRHVAAASATLSGHEQDVRAVSSMADGAAHGIARQLRKVWRRSSDEEGAAYTSTTLLGHTHYVIAVAATPTGIASGSNDKHVIEWDLSTSLPARVLEGHTNTVSCVAYSPSSNTLLSASWDSTVKVWKEGTCLYTLKGHEATIWCVLPVEDEEGHVLTASGDRTYALSPHRAASLSQHAHPLLLSLSPSSTLSSSSLSLFTQKQHQALEGRHLCTDLYGPYRRREIVSPC